MVSHAYLDMLSHQISNMYVGQVTGNDHPFSMFSNGIYALFAYSCFAYSRFAYFIPKSGISPATCLTVLCTVLNINIVLNIQYNINTKTLQT